MSGLTLPRIIFAGTTRWNPNTVNNHIESYDEVAVAPTLDGKSFAQYSAWLYEMNPKGTDLNGSWNVFGDHGVKFLDLQVTRVEPAAGAADPLLGQPVVVQGSSSAARLVDIDPYSPFTSQIFYQTFALGDATLGVSGPGSCRMFSRWPNFGRNLNQDGSLVVAGSMGVVWQAALPKATLTWNGVASSPALAALKDALEADPTHQGLVFLFASYRTLYYQTVTWQGQRITTAEELGSAYKAGFTGGNPAESETLGRLSVWGAGELASAPTGDRLLVPVSPVTIAPLPLAREVRPAGHLLRQMAAGTEQPVTLGPAQARLDTARQVVVLDFLATFPEQDANLAKADLGSFLLQVVPADGSTPVPVGAPLTYEQYAEPAYLAGGGIVEISFADNPGLAAVIATGTLELASAAEPGVVALGQVSLVAETDQRGAYLDQGGTTTITVQTYQNGATPPTEAVSLLVVPYDEGMDQITDPSQAIFALLDGSGKPLPANPVLPVDATGATVLTVAPLQPGIGYFFFFPFTGSVPPTPPASFANGIAPDNYYAVLRALPWDDALDQDTPASGLTWQFIYQNVLSTWDVVYPLMSTILPLSSEKAVDQAAAAIVERLDDPLVSTQYMPVTRDMSAGKKALLLRYLSQQ